ncbi:diguanylate cyclase [Roseomonas nepalensis]|uniref:diguanylate cyclase n=1 Tax=Muricoccus nepalensis TaxID=1854500 RepID=A0A502G0U4_9PROT|nr:diguanylate cyclase [Roseomonas nepalensis]
MAARLSPWHVVLAALGVTCCVGALAFFSIAQIRHDAWEEARVEGRNLVGLLSREVGRTLHSFDLSLRAAAENASLPGLAEVPLEIRQAAVFERAATSAGPGAILILDEAGNIALDSRSEPPRIANFSDWEAFRVHGDGLVDGLFVGVPTPAQLRGGWILPMSRAIRAADGRFQGVVLGGIDLAVLLEAFAGIQLGANGSSTLHRRDGATMLRMPFDPRDIGRNVAGGRAFQRFLETESGEFSAQSALDGAERLYIFSQVSGLPLIVNVARGTSDLARGWHQRAWLPAAALGAVLVALSFATWLLVRELRRRERVEAALSESEAKFRLLAENSYDMVTRIGSDGVRRYVSPASVRLLGRRPEELVGKRPQEIVHPADLEILSAAVVPLRRGEVDEATIAYRVLRSDDRWVWLESTVKVVFDPVSGARDGLVAITRDTTERKAVEERLTRLASMDGLTGIANRRAFDEALLHEWHHAARTGYPVSLLMIDVDRFKALNDSQGHLKGDECLRAIAEALGGSACRRGDLAARYGGEEFVLLLPDADAAGAAAVAERVRAAVEGLRIPHPEGGLGGVVTVSVGAATTWPSAALPPAVADLAGAADGCLYEAKLAGRNRVVGTVLGDAPPAARDPAARAPRPVAIRQAVPAGE